VDVLSKDQPVGTLKNIIDKAEIRIGYVETDAYPLLSVTKNIKSNKNITSKSVPNSKFKNMPFLYFKRRNERYI